MRHLLPINNNIIIDDDTDTMVVVVTAIIGFIMFFFFMMLLVLLVVVMIAAAAAADYPPDNRAARSIKQMMLGTPNDHPAAIEKVGVFGSLQGADFGWFGGTPAEGANRADRRVACVLAPAPAGNFKGSPSWRMGSVRQLGIRTVACQAAGLAGERPRAKGEGRVMISSIRLEPSAARSRQSGLSLPR